MFKHKNKIIILVGCGLLVLVLVGIFLFFDKTPDDIDDGSTVDGSEQSEFPKLEIYSTVEKGEWIVVSTSYGEIKYPYSFSDIISVEVSNQENSSQLKFFLQMEDVKEMIYAIHYNNEIGTFLGNLSLENYPDSIPVGVEFGQPSEFVQKNFLDSFYATKDTFNDVLTSMCDTESFVFIK